MSKQVARQGALKDDLRDRIITEPSVILDDRDVMRALVAAGEEAMGRNVVDLRGLAMERLEARLERLEDTHRHVIAAAYDNVAGTNQAQRAVLRLLEPQSLAEFLTVLCDEVPHILRVDMARLVVESAGRETNIPGLAEVLTVRAPGFIDAYIQKGRGVTDRAVTLRSVPHGDSTIYGEDGGWMRSEACVRLDLGAGRQAAMLHLGSEDPTQFAPQHGTDLLTFFGGVVERALRRWLA